MEYRIEQKEAFTIIGKSVRVTCQNNEHTSRIPLFWEECQHDGTLENICAIGTSETLFGVCMDMDMEKGEFTYMIAAAADVSTQAAGLSVRTIPACLWAMFPSVGPIPDALQNVWGRVFQEWLPASDYKHAAAPEMEVYPPGDVTRDDYRCEVWIPVVKK